MEEVTTFTETATEALNAVDTIHEQVNRASSVFSGMAKYFTSMMPSVITAVIVLILGVLISRLIARISAKALRQSALDSGAKRPAG